NDCAVSYLSMAPSGLEQVLLTPPIDAGCTAEAVYGACYKRVPLQNMKFYQRFPQDEELVREIVLHLFENWLDFDTNPLNALMHEPIYCQGAASNWAAQKVRDELDEQFDPVFAAKHSEPVLFTGEVPMYVNVNLSEATAASIPRIRLWITNEFMQDGYHLLAMLKGLSF
ncbi:uncharacterized protein LOC112348243, partial [Selaginella moellendorffii]|uniref:uncharacterized protein LOC112348243 n=1 Tax=Selaginella moellendorffii TaxID=88036 RepID=UPI000D1C478B